MTFLISALPQPFDFFRPFMDVLPLVPVLFFLLAFLWQALVEFR